MSRSANTVLSHEPGLRRARLGTSVIVLLLFAAPFLLAAYHQFDGFSFANESIAYRWGHPSRTLSGDVPPILPQGFTVSAAQQGLVRTIEAFNPVSATTLHRTLQIFSWGTLGLFILSFLPILITAARNQRLGPTHVILVFLPWITAIYSTGTAGFYYCLAADYYSLNAILACAAILCLLPFIKSLSDPTTFPAGSRHILMLGLVLGLGVANKITWGVPSLVALAAVLLAGPMNFRRMLIHSLILSVSATLTALLVLLAYYQFSPRLLAQGAGEWLRFMQGQQGEFALWSPAFYAMLRRYNCDALYPLQLLAVLTCLGVVRGWRAQVFTAVCAAGFISVLWAATQRPAGSSFWDLNVLLLLHTSAAILTVTKLRAQRWLTAGWIVAVAVLVLRQPPTAIIPKIASTQLSSAQRFDAFDEINRFAAGREQLVIFVNNEYHHEGVHELLLKAAADFPSWNITVGQAWLGRIWPRASFLHEYGPPIVLPADFAELCVVWFDRPDLPPLTNRFPILARFAIDPAYEQITLPIYRTSQQQPRPVQIQIHAIRKKTTPKS